MKIPDTFTPVTPDWLSNSQSVQNEMANGLDLQGEGIRKLGNAGGYDEEGASGNSCCNDLQFCEAQLLLALEQIAELCSQVPSDGTWTHQYFDVTDRPFSGLRHYYDPSVSLTLSSIPFDASEPLTWTTSIEAGYKYSVKVHTYPPYAEYDKQYLSPAPLLPLPSFQVRPAGSSDGTSLSSVPSTSDGDYEVVVEFDKVTPRWLIIGTFSVDVSGTEPVVTFTSSICDDIDDIDDE